MSLTIISILTISFIAALVRSTLGFGESLIAVPLFLFFLPATTAVPLSVMLSIIIALIIVIQDHRKIHFYSAKWLIIYAIPGIPLGLLILVYGNEILVKTVLGLLIIGYALYTLVAKTTKRLTRDSHWWLFICGFLSGVFGGAYGVNGPPLVVYGNLRNWSAAHFRATLQAYFLPVSLLGFGGYAAKGLVTAEVNDYFLIALTTSIPATFLGRWLNGKLNSRSFLRYVLYGLMIIGVILILMALYQDPAATI
ncbi:MAG: sulfite exporter TauE/SafE family protein [Niabella sp.]|nr:sulfite exporter TauE/SafE family protein [Niabella sp.]